MNERYNMKIKEKIMQYMNSKSYTPKTREKIAEHFEIHPRDRKDFYKLLKAMEKDGLIVKTKKERYVTSESGYLKGNMARNAKGFGFFTPENSKDEIFIAEENMNNAMHGDEVLVEKLEDITEDKKAEGRVVKILRHATDKIVGIYQNNGAFGFVIPDESKLGDDVYIKKENSLNALDGQKVLAKIIKRAKGEKGMEGKIVEVLGFPDDLGVDVLSVIKAKDIPYEFPNKVLNMAENIPKRVSENEIKDRTDFRDEIIFTIDGIDAKDLDDAVHIKKLDNAYELGVHIADVSHYVKENSALDDEALKRGNSVYLLDRVVPMLPKALSNGICSLNPNEERLTLSVIMKIDNRGKVLDHKICEGVIKTVARLDYKTVSNFLEAVDEGDSLSDEVKDSLKLMEELTKILHEAREEKGALDFDFPETKIDITPEGEVTDVYKYERRIANRLIEEFMLITNEVVSEEYYWRESPFLYRIHDKPDEEKMREFLNFIRGFGYGIKGLQNDIHPKELAEILDEIKGKDEEQAISQILLRSLKKARYSEEASIHYGLSSNYYSHFTSPIRRYPDLQIHRIIKETLNGGLTEQRTEHYRAIMPKIADQTSMTERRAEEAERIVEDIKKAEYISKHIGEQFEGMICSITKFGIFVQLKNTIEGLIAYQNMEDDYYEFNEIEFLARGQKTGREYRLGQNVKIEVVSADPTKGQIDFKFVGEVKDVKN
ncbi:MAG: ribonuclease R [Tissierellia bacterium]|nr:ribonuclease R [Tissierellia bacterium]